MTDLHLALRVSSRHRGFALTVVLTLAITVGATAAVFAAVHAVLLRALPYDDAERLVWVASVRADNPGAPFTLPEFMDYRARSRTLAGLAAYGSWSASLAGEGAAERLSGARMSANAFEVLGATPAAGRLLRESDDRPDAPRVVVLSHRVWQRRFGGLASAVGTTVRINGEPHEIVGVLPPHFPLPLRDIDVVTALVPERDPLRHARASVNFLRLVGRLRPDSDAREAQAELTAICRALRTEFPVAYARKEAVRVDPLHATIVADFRQAMRLLLAAVGVVLATALANVLSLALVRANARRAELAMRLALGASRLRLARQLGVEGMLLASAGGALGWVIATQIVALGARWAPAAVPRLSEVRLDAASGVLVLVISSIAAAALTAAPLSVLLRTRTNTRRASGVRHGIVVFQVAAALVLLLAALALVQHVRHLSGVHPGFNTDGVFQARVTVPPSYRSPSDVIRFYETLTPRLATAPGVSHVGVISAAPLSGVLSTVPFSVAGRPVEARERAMANFRVISAGYLATVGTRVLTGRPFAETDRQDAAPVALVSEALADRFLEGDTAGQRLLIDDNNAGPRAVEIVGVVENVRQSALDLPPALDIYLPLPQVHPDGVGLLRNNQFWVVRTAGAPGAFRATFLDHLRSVDADAAVSGSGPMAQFVDAWLGPRRFNAGLFIAFSLGAMLLAVAGAYALVAYAVSQRTREIGLRMALGATPRHVQQLVLGQAVRLIALGVSAGVAAALVARPFLSSLTVNATSAPWLSGVSAVVVALAVFTASWLPARRAMAIDPTIALRTD